MVRPQDLQLPYIDRKPRILFHDHFWSVPPAIDPETFVFPGWDALFTRTAPIVVEYCSGHGHWVTERAKQFPEYNWLAVEKRLDRSKRIWSKIKNHNLSNCVVAGSEGLLLTKSYFPDHSVSEVFINFPDPWPKNRHAKHRIIDLEFLDEMARILKPNGTITFTTDDQRSSDLFLKLIEKQQHFTHALPVPFFTPLPDEYGTSFFGDLFKEQGKENRLHKLVLQDIIIQEGK